MLLLFCCKLRISYTLKIGCFGLKQTNEKKLIIMMITLIHGGHFAEARRALLSLGVVVTIQFTATSALGQQQDNAYQQGIDALNKHDYDRAIANFSQAIEINPRDADAYTNRALAKEKIGDFDEAISDYSHAIEINPQDTDAYVNRGIAKQKSGDSDGAISDYSHAIEFDSRDDLAYYNRGTAKMDKRDFNGAVADFNQAIEISPRTALFYNERGIAKKDTGDLDGAIADYNQALALDPNNVLTYNNRGVARCKKGDYDGAIADYSQAIQINPGFFNAYNNRGTAKMEKGDLEAALSDLIQAIEINSRYPEAYYNRALVKDKKGDHAGAVADYNQAIALGLKRPGNSPSAPPSASSGPGQSISMGTGFFVTSTGYILTDFHVVKGASTIRVKIGTSFVPATVVAKDTDNDIALLKVHEASFGTGNARVTSPSEVDKDPAAAIHILTGSYPCLPLGDSSAVSLGQAVFTIGFPEPQLEGLSPKLTRGDISSLEGMQDDPRTFQVSLPIQPGNSGGCLVDREGNVVGLIESTLSTVAAASHTGVLLQNVNYATKINYAKTLLNTVQDANSGLVPLKTASLPFTDEVKSAEEATVFIVAGS